MKKAYEELDHLHPEEDDSVAGEFVTVLLLGLIAAAGVAVLARTPFDYSALEATLNVPAGTYT